MGIRTWMRRRPGSQSGQAVLMGVLAFLLLAASIGSSLYYIGPKMTLRQQQSAAAKSTEIIRKALWTFAARNYRLPCPTDGQTTGASAGIESFNGSTCTVFSNHGVVPWRTLGIQSTDALDGWDIL